MKRKSHFLKKLRRNYGGGKKTIMRITLVFDGLQYGGIERVGIEYIKLLRNNGYDLQIINLNPELTDIEQELPSEVNVVHIKYPQKLAAARHSKYKQRIWVKSLGVAIARWITGCVNHIYSLTYASKILDTDLAIAFSGHFNDLAFIVQNFKYKKKMAWLHGSQYSYLASSSGYFELYCHVKNLVCLSNQDDDKVERFNLENHINKIKIYNPINLSSKNIDLKKVTYLKKEYGDFILMVGRLERDKDQETLIRAVKLLHEKFNLKNKLILVGDGKERSKLEKIVEEFGMNEFIIFEGLRKDVQNYYTAAKIYAHSSPAEGLPTVLLEAMYYKCPIVSTNSEPGTREILEENCGLISPVGDANALAENIYKMYSDDICRESCISAGEKRIKEFMPEQIINQLEVYIRNLL